MARQYLSAKPVARQVLDRESPSEATNDRRAPSADTPVDPVSAAPSRQPLVWVSRPGEDGTDPTIRAAKAAFFASLPAERSASPPPARTGGRPRKTDPEVEAMIERMEGSMSQARKKIGRNDPCPCGSGKKYKKCCLIEQEI